MQELTIAEVFLVLKPLCDSFVNKPSEEKAEKIALLVNRTSNVIIQKVYENILYPITYHLKNNTLSKDENLKLINTIRTVIIKIRVDNSKLFYEIYHCLRSQICQQKNTMELIEVHEELKESVILCLKDLIKNISTSIVESFYVRQHAALISHGIYLCIKIARLEKSTSLRLAAIETVMTLLQVHEDADTQDVVLRNQIADVIMLYLPGVASGLLEVALGSDVQNHKITMMAIRGWSRAIALVMQDMPQEDNTGTVSLLMLENIVRSKDPSDLEKMKHILETAKRTPEWYLTVSKKFKLILVELDTLTKHSHFKVRKELAQGVACLLLNCSRNMKPCFQILLEILITLSEDENSEVAHESKEALQKIQDKCTQDVNMKSVVEILEENLYDLLTKTPRIIRTSGESIQLVWLNRLAGYLKILGKQRLSKVLLSTSHLRKLLLTLMYIAEMDSSIVSVLDDAITTNFEENIYHEGSHCWKQFKFLFDISTVKKLNSIFQILGELGDRKILVDSILQMILEIPKFKKELTLMLNTIIEVPTDSSIEMSICKQVIDHYTESDYWNLPVKVSDDITLHMAQSNIIQCCLLLEGFKITAKVLQENYQYFLLKTLYLIIEKAGSEHSLLRFIGLSTLEIIAKSQNVNSVGELFQINIDYISYHVTLRLRRIERNPEVLDVIGVVTKYSTIDFLPHLKHIVDDLLLQCGSNIQKRNVRSFLKVFYAFAMCVKRLTSHKDSKRNEKYLEDVKTLKSTEIINKFLEYYNAKKNSKIFEKDDELKNDIHENMLHGLQNDNSAEEKCTTINDHIEDEKEIKIPYFVKMIKDIMKRCIHFLPSQDFTESSLAMLTLKEGVLILKEWENELLPIIHELWHPLVDRFQNSNPLVINQAWQLLCCLAKVSQEFIRSRTLKQILPALSSFLKKSSKESYKKDSGSTYKYTQMFKLQKEILSHLGQIIKDLKLLERDIWNIMDIAEPYLDSLQNLLLQECCVNMYIEISEYSTDIVWIKCIDTWNRCIEPVTSENNLNFWYSKAMNVNTKNGYYQNLQKILTYINTKGETL